MRVGSLLAKESTDSVSGYEDMREPGIAVNDQDTFAFGGCILLGMSRDFVAGASTLRLQHPSHDGTSTSAVPVRVDTA